MIDHEAQLKLQAYLDGELPESEATQVKALLERDAEARLLLAELQNTEAALKGHEAGLKLPESREFFWSKIEREIQRQEQRAERARENAGWGAWLRRQFVPLSGLAVLALVMGILFFRPGAAEAEPGETEMAREDMGAYTFRDQQNKMTVVWFYDRAGNSQFTGSKQAASMNPQ